MQTNTLPELAQLTALARKIRDTHDAAVKLAQATLKKSGEAVAEAILCGQALNEAKELVPHGQWLKWLSDHCKNVSEATAQRYMKLSKTAHVRDLNGSESLRQLYIATGIISEPTKEPCEKPNPANEPEKTSGQPVMPSNQKTEEVAPMPSEIKTETSSPIGAEAPQALIPPTSPIVEGVFDPDPFIDVESSPVTPPDELAHLRLLVRRVMDEITRLGSGMSGGVSVEIGPITQWTKEHGFA